MCAPHGAEDQQKAQHDAQGDQLDRRTNSPDDSGYVEFEHEISTRPALAGLQRWRSPCTAQDPAVRAHHSAEIGVHFTSGLQTRRHPSYGHRSDPVLDAWVGERGTSLKMARLQSDSRGAVTR